MSFHEPSALEVFITVAVGNLFGGFYKTAVESLELQGRERVLDFGSGAGTPARLLTRKLLQDGGQVTCVDISEVWLKTAVKRLARFPNVEFKLGEISSLGLPDAAYDVVFIHFVLHDIPAGQRPHVVTQLAQKLAAGGRLAIREPLNAISQEEIRRLMERSRLAEFEASVGQVPLMGPTYQGVFAKKEQGHAQTHFFSVGPDGCDRRVGGLRGTCWLRHGPACL
jgi:ubiquinone/menaquinone biosynthesis C-methylase UbiE